MTVNIFFEKYCSCYQTIVNHVTIRDVTAPHLGIKYLNNDDIRNYMRVNSNNTSPTNYHFKNVTIIGNIFLNNSKLIPDLKNIDRESVKFQGK